MDYYKIGQRICKYRKVLGLSQEELAERTNISTTHMSHIEPENTKLSLPVLIKLASVLDVSTDELLTDGKSGKTVVLQELSEILECCTPTQARLLIDIIKTTKQSIDKYL